MRVERSIHVWMQYPHINPVIYGSRTVKYDSRTSDLRMKKWHSTCDWLYLYWASNSVEHVQPIACGVSLLHSQICSSWVIYHSSWDICYSQLHVECHFFILQSEVRELYITVREPYVTAYCMWSVISSFSNLNRWSSSLGLFYRVPLKRDQGDWDWRLRFNDTAHARGCIIWLTNCDIWLTNLRLEIAIQWHCTCKRLYHMTHELWHLTHELEIGDCDSMTLHMQEAEIHCSKLIHCSKYSLLHVACHSLKSAYLN